MALIENDVFIEDFELTRESGQSQSQQAQGLGLCLELDQPPVKGMRFSVHRICSWSLGSYNLYFC